MSDGKWISLIALGQQFADHLLLRRFLAGMAMLFVLISLCGVLLGSLAAAGLYGMHLMLLAQGMEAVRATALTACAAAGLVIAMLLYTLHYARRVIRVPRLMATLEASVGARLRPLGEAFVDGLLTHPAEKRAHH